MKKWMLFLLLLCLPLLPRDGKAEKDVAIFDLRAVSEQRREKGRAYLEMLRVGTLSAGLYELPKGAEDHQPTHEWDEIYYVVNGRAHFTALGDSHPVGAGSVIYVRAGVAHRFTAIEEPLQVLVMFSFAAPVPAERE